MGFHLFFAMHIQIGVARKILACLHSNEGATMGDNIVIRGMGADLEPEN